MSIAEAAPLWQVGSEFRPDLLEIFVGNSRTDSYGTWWDGSILIYESFGPNFQGCEQILLAPASAQWRHFWQSVDTLGVWDWDARYEPGRRFEPDDVVRTGVHWSVELEHAGRRVSSSGDGAGPGSVDLDESVPFAVLVEAVSRLLGGRPFI